MVVLHSFAAASFKIASSDCSAFLFLDLFAFWVEVSGGSPCVYHVFILHACRNSMACTVVGNCELTPLDLLTAKAAAAHPRLVPQPPACSFVDYSQY